MFSFVKKASAEAQEYMWGSEVTKEQYEGWSAPQDDIFKHYDEERAKLDDGLERKGSDAPQGGVPPPQYGEVGVDNFCENHESYADACVKRHGVLANDGDMYCGPLLRAQRSCEKYKAEAKQTIASKCSGSDAKACADLHTYIYRLKALGYNDQERNFAYSVSVLPRYNSLMHKLEPASAHPDTDGNRDILRNPEKVVELMEKIIGGDLKKKYTDADALFEELDRERYPTKDDDQKIADWLDDWYKKNDPTPADEKAKPFPRRVAIKMREASDPSYDRAPDGARINRTLAKAAAAGQYELVSPHLEVRDGRLAFKSEKDYRQAYLDQLNTYFNEMKQFETNDNYDPELQQDAPNVHSYEYWG